MKKNVASQRIGAQLVSASDGSAFTGSVTVAVTGDAGTQATGSVGSGACTHEGNGYHTYAPAQAETNYDLVAFTFTGTGAVPVTVQIYTRPTNDYASQDSVTTIDDFLDTEVAAIKAKTDNLPTDPADASDIASSFSTVNGTLATLATAANLAIVAGYIDTEVAAIKAKTDNLPADPADASDIAASFSAVNSALTTIDDFLDTEIAAITTAVADIPTNAELATALASSDDATLAAIAALNNLSAAQVNAEVLDVLNVDTFAELSSVPAATSSLRAKLTWLFMWARNKSTQTSTQRKLYLDDGTTVVGTEAVSDDGTTYTKGEVA
jgi:hypothetical protein